MLKKTMENPPHPETAFFSCIGRWIGAEGRMLEGKSPCNFTNGGLIRLSPIVVTDGEGKDHWTFDFAEDAPSEIAALPGSGKTSTITERVKAEAANG